MELILAMDLKGGLVVHGKSGQRAGYKPLDWGCSPTAEPVGFVRAVAPKYIYIADLDRIEKTGSHDRIIAECARKVSACYADRGCHSPDDLFSAYHVINIVGTETGGEDLSQYRGGFLSLDMINGRVIPSGLRRCAIAFGSLNSASNTGAPYFSSSSASGGSIARPQRTVKRRRPGRPGKFSSVRIQRNCIAPFLA